MLVVSANIILLRLLINPSPQYFGNHTDYTFFSTLSIGTKEVVADGEKCTH